MIIEIKENIFEIIRYEGWGYVQNKCKFDKNIFKLEILLEPSGLEGGSCKTIYKFQILKNNNSYIKFTQDYYGDKNYEYYFYDSNLNYVIAVDKGNKQKCIIL